MRKVKFNVGKTSDGFDAYAKLDDASIVTMGDTLGELKTNVLEAYNEYAEFHKKKKIKENDILFEFDLQSFFEAYGIINASALSNKIGMSKTLLSQYVNGSKKPSAKQVKKIAAGLKEVGKELSELSLAI